MDLSGKIFGELTVKERHSKYKWLCECSCGAHTIVVYYQLLSGHTKSCGHTRKENLHYITHNMCKTRLYQCYHSMFNRCKHRKEYLKNNIHVCEQWANSFEEFACWAMANGYNDELTLERKDVYGDYCPENCEWASRVVQADNKTNTIYLNHNGEVKTLTQWAKELNINRQTLYMRWFRGMSEDSIFCTERLSKKKGANYE